MGHSQGAAATGTADGDPRQSRHLLWNSGASNDKPFLNVSGDRDVGYSNAGFLIKTSTEGATQPGAWAYYHQVFQTVARRPGTSCSWSNPIGWRKWRSPGGSGSSQATRKPRRCSLETGLRSL